MRDRGEVLGALHAAALGVVVVSAILAAGCSTPKSRTVLESRDAGVRWLVTNQNADGSFGRFESARPNEIYLDNLSSHHAFHVATTALCAWALIEPARGDPKAAATLDRALLWIAAAPLAGRASGSTFYDVWAHTYLLELSAAVLADPRLAPYHERFRALAIREVLFSRQEQAADGGWGYYDFGASFLHPTGNMSTSFNTAAMILALRAVERQGVEIPAGMVQDGIRSLRTAQLPNGSFSYGTDPTPHPQANYNKVRGASGRLQVCNLALFTEGQGVDRPTLQRGLEHLRDHHHYIAIARGRPIPHEAFYQNSGYYYYFGHYYASRNVVSLDDGTPKQELGRWLAGVLIDDQHENGSWFDYPLYGYGHAYATGYGTLSMSELIPVLDPPAAAAASR